MAPKPPSDGSDDWRLPDRPFIPGQTERPGEDDDVHRVARAAPNPTDPAKWRRNQAWRAGLRLYRHGYFWEAHEVWEAVWANARPNSAERALVQCVIQLANAGLKQRMGRPHAVRRLAAIAAAHADDAAAGGDRLLMGLEIAGLRATIQRYQQALKTDDDAPVPDLAAE